MKITMGLRERLRYGKNPKDELDFQLVENLTKWTIRSQVLRVVMKDLWMQFRGQMLVGRRNLSKFR